MTTITDNKPSAALLGAVNGGTASAQSTAQEAQDRFMKLLVTQMKNQDPLNPMDNAQMTSQLAQLSTVTGIDKLNVTLESLKGSFQSSQTLEATSMIGHGVLVPGSNMTLAGGQAMLGVELPTPADSVKVNIKDASGKVIHTIDLGAMEEGIYPLQWDGKTDNGSAAAEGKYTFEVSAVLSGNKTTANALEFGQVASVSSNTQGVRLNVPTLGPVNLSDIRQIL